MKINEVELSFVNGAYCGAAHPPRTPQIKISMNSSVHGCFNPKLKKEANFE